MRLRHQMADTHEKLGIQSAEVAAEILEALTRIGRSAQLKDLAAEAGMPPAKVHRYLVSLVRTNLVAQDPDSGFYSIGSQSIMMGLVGLRGLDVVRLAGAALPTLRQRTEETAILAIWTDNGPVVVQFDESARPVYMNVRVGSVLPIPSTAVGLAFAAHIDRRIVDAVLRSHAVHRMSTGGEGAFEAQLERVRRDGIAFVHGSLVSGVSAVAAPIFDHKDMITGVIGVIGRQEDVTRTFDTVIVPSVRDVATDLTRRLGGDLNAPQRAR